MQLLRHRGTMDLLVLQRLMLKLLALHGHRGEGEGHGLEDLGPDLLVHGRGLSLASEADRQAVLVEQDGLPGGPAPHHGHLGQGLGHAGGGDVGGGHARHTPVPARLPRGGGRGDRLRRFGFVDLGGFGGGSGARASQFSAVHVGSQWSTKALDAG